MDPVTGKEVIGIPGQCLDDRELRYMVGLADGDNNAQLAQAINLPPDALPFIEASIRDKLGAKSKAHMLSRAFTLGVLQARALIMLLSLAMAFSGFLYYRTHSMPEHGHAIDYDIMAAGTLGPATLDPHYVQLLLQKMHSS